MDDLHNSVFVRSAPGQTQQVRWLDDDDAGFDAGLGIDDFELEARDDPPPVPLTARLASPAALQGNDETLLRLSHPGVARRAIARVPGSNSMIALQDVAKTQDRGEWQGSPGRIAWVGPRASPVVFHEAVVSLRKKGPVARDDRSSREVVFALQLCPRMNISWKDYCSWLERLATRKLRDVEPVNMDSKFDETPLAGYFEIGLHRVGGARHTWIRFRERPEGVFFQIDDAAWRPMPGLDSRAAGEVFDDFVHGFEEPRSRYPAATLHIFGGAGGHPLGGRRSVAADVFERKAG